MRNRERQQWKGNERRRGGSLSIGKERLRERSRDKIGGWHLYCVTEPLRYALLNHTHLSSVCLGARSNVFHCESVLYLRYKEMKSTLPKPSPVIHTHTLTHTHTHTSLCGQGLPRLAASHVYLTALVSLALTHTHTHTHTGRDTCYSVKPHPGKGSHNMKRMLDV